MERSNLKPGNSSDGNGVLKIAVHEIIKNPRKGSSPCLLALPSEHHVALSVTEAMHG